LASVRYDFARILDGRAGGVSANQHAIVLFVDGTGIAKHVRK
jgi:hypothetical protein